MSVAPKRYDPALYQQQKAARIARARAWWLANVGEPQPVVRRPYRIRRGAAVRRSP